MLYLLILLRLGTGIEGVIVRSVIVHVCAGRLGAEVCAGGESRISGGGRCSETFLKLPNPALELQSSRITMIVRKALIGHGKSAQSCWLSKYY